MQESERFGARVEFSGAGVPGPVVLTGTHVRLEPVVPQRHAREIAARTDDSHYDYLPYGPFGADGLRDRLTTLAAGADTLPLAVCNVSTGRALGLLTLLRPRPADGAVEVGHVLLGTGLARTTAATEAFSLLAHHVLDDLGMRRYEWKCHDRNTASRRAARRLGFVPGGVFRQDRVVKGRNRDTAWFSILDGEWPQLRTAYGRWLDPANHVDGRQVRTLEQVRADVTEDGPR